MDEWPTAKTSTEQRDLQAQEAPTLEEKTEALMRFMKAEWWRARLEALERLGVRL